MVNTTTNLKYINNALKLIMQTRNANSNTHSCLVWIVLKNKYISMMKQKITVLKYLAFMTL